MGNSINEGDGNYVKSKFGIGCVGDKLDFSKKTDEGMRIPYFNRVKINYE